MNTNAISFSSVRDKAILVIMMAAFLISRASPFYGGLLWMIAGVSALIFAFKLAKRFYYLWAIMGIASLLNGWILISERKDIVTFILSSPG